MAETTVLIVEDEKKLAAVMADYLRQSAYQTHCIYHGDEVIAWVEQHQPSAILLDLMLPGKDGMQLCKEIRAFSNVPILMVTARVDEIDRLLGLEIGADDYICKPFSPREVVARVKAVLRRSQARSEIGSVDFTLDDDRFLARYQDKTIEFTSVEYQLLRRLSSDPGRIFSRNQLMDTMYDDHRVVSDRTIDSHVKKLRAKLTDQFPQQNFIHSVYGVGYKFEISEPEE